MENEMKSTLINERVLGSRRVSGDAPDPKSRFQVSLARINQELWRCSLSS
jgi:hypothetical protein